MARWAPASERTMLLQEMDTPLDVEGVTRLTLQVAAPTFEMTQVAVAAPPVDLHTTYVGRTDEQWDWQALRDYVVREIEARFGPAPRDARKEAGIFKSFLARWGSAAPAIARFAFESHDGYWRGAPISVNRFCLASDEYFAAVIRASLAERQAAQ